MTPFRRFWEAIEDELEKEGRRPLSQGSARAIWHEAMKIAREESANQPQEQS